MKIFKIFLVFILSCSFALLLYLWFSFQGPAPSKEKERYVIQLKAPPEQDTINDLVSKGFLKNKDIFSFILGFKKWHNKMEPGAYLISKGMNAYELAETLASGPYQKWIIIPPGKRKEQVAVIVKRALEWSNALSVSFVKVAKEGYLFPDTYLINVDADPQQVSMKLENNFTEKFYPELRKELFDQNIRYDTAIKIASLIERESGGSEDKPIIAGIIWNRLLKGMRLEIDATVQYVIASENCQLTKDQPMINECNFWPKVTVKMLRTIDSLYNTYLNKGLPPGPIASPSLASIEAVARPAKTDAFYYLHSPDKQIHTARTYQEHLGNIKKYLQ